jgi:hypothetical protein
MARPVILAVNSDPQVPRANFGETAPDILDKLQLRSNPITLDSRPGETCFVGRLPVEEP